MRPNATDHETDNLAERRRDATTSQMLEREKLLAKNLNTGFAVSVVNGLVLAFFLFPRSSATLVVSWFAVIFATNLIRCVIARKVSAAGETLGAGDMRWILMMTAVSGVCWGASPFLILETTPRSEHFAIFMIAGMTAAASLSYATHLRIVIAFNLTALSTLVAFYMVGGDHPEYALSGILLLYLAGTVIFARRSGETIANAIANKHLAEKRQAEIEANSEILSREVAARRASEFKLKTALSRNREFNEALDTLYRSYIAKGQATDSLIKNATKRVSRILRVERVSVWMFSDCGERLICEDLYESTNNNHSDGITLYERDYPAYFDALRDSRVIIVEDAENDPRTSCFTQSYLKPANIKSMLDSPLRAGRGLCGVICCESVGEKREWTVDEITFLTCIAQFISMSLFFDDAQASAHKLQTALVDAEKANEAKSAFLATMSHEIRTPMNGVLGATALLQKRELESDIEGYVNIIDDCGKSLMSVLNDILDVSKLEAGKFEIEQTIFSIRETLRSIQSIYNLKAEEKGLKFEASVTPDVADLRTGDSHRIMQILHNLVANAMKFTERGSVVVTIDNADAGAASTAAIKITVADTGIGMSADQADNIFESFVQADSSMSRRYGGSGLGLSIVKGIIDAMDGAISVASSPGEGAVFEAVIPLPVASSAGDPEDGERDGSVVTWEKLSILVAEDNAINRMIIDAFLKQTGAQVTYVENGRLAVDAVADGHFDIALMDIHMPEMDGVEALLEIRKRERAENRQPLQILAVTADAMQQEKSRYLETGFNDHLPKPINEAALLQAIENALDMAPKNTAAA